MFNGFRTDWKEFKENGQYYRIRAIFGWQSFEGQPPYWSVTYEQDILRGTWQDDSCGANSPYIKNHFPHVASQWHLSSLGTPMHYVENAVYWAEHIVGVSQWVIQSVHIDPIDAFKMTVLFGEVEGDTMPVFPSPPAPLPSTIDYVHDDAKEMRQRHMKAFRNQLRRVVERWCAARRPALLAKMKADMDHAWTFGLECAKPHNED